MAVALAVAGALQIAEIRQAPQTELKQFAEHMVFFTATGFAAVIFAEMGWPSGRDS